MEQFNLKSTQGRLVLLASIIGSGLGFLATSILNIAVPDMQSDFDASITDMQWILNSYAIVAAGLILASGALGDVVGRKRLFLGGIAIFGLGTVLSGMAPTVSLLIPFRVMQGFGAALMVPQSLALIEFFIVANNKGAAIGLWSGVSSGISALGPLVGGFMVDEVGWRATFFIQIPFAIIAFITILLLVPDDETKKGKIDWVGTVLISLSLLLITTVMIQSNEWGWMSVETLSISLLASILFIIFIITQLRFNHPLFDLSILKNWEVAGANIVTFFIYFTLSGVFFFVTLNLIQLQEYSATRAGIALLPPILILTFFSWLPGVVADKIGSRLLMTVGCFIVGLGLFTMVLTAAETNYWTSFFPALVLFGLGMVLLVPSLTKSAMNVDQKHSGSASGLNNTVSRAAGVIAIALLGTFAIIWFTNTLEGRLIEDNVSIASRNEVIDQADELLDLEISQNISDLQQKVIKEDVHNSFLETYQVIMIIGVVLSFFGALVSFITIPGKSFKK